MGEVIPINSEKEPTQLQCDCGNRNFLIGFHEADQDGDTFTTFSCSACDETILILCNGFEYWPDDLDDDLPEL